LLCTLWQINWDHHFVIWDLFYENWWHISKLHSCLIGQINYWKSLTNELIAECVLMLTNAEIWIAVLFHVGCKGLTAGNVNLQTVLCLLCADKIMTKNMINVRYISTCC
jgi:hypothetical protein